MIVEQHGRWSALNLKLQVCAKRMSKQLEWQGKRNTSTLTKEMFTEKHLTHQIIGERIHPFLNFRRIKNLVYTP